MQFLHFFLSCFNVPLPTDLLGLFGFCGIFALILWLGGLVREI